MLLTEFSLMFQHHTRKIICTMLAHTSQTTLHKKDLHCYLDLSGPKLHKEITHAMFAHG